MIAFTHSHTAIPFRFEGIAFADDKIVAESIKGYIDVFTKLVADCVILANLRLKPAIPSFGKGEVFGISFCRDYYMKNGTPQTNPPRTSPEIIGSVTESDKELPVLMVKGVKISADNTDPNQYKLAMAKRLIDFLNTTPKSFDVPLQCMQIGEFTIYGFNSEIFTEFGKLVKKGDGTGINLVATLCNEAFGYVPTRDMFFDTIYESRPGSSRLDKEAGYIMAEKLVSMKDKMNKK